MLKNKELYLSFIIFIALWLCNTLLGLIFRMNAIFSDQRWIMGISILHSTFILCIIAILCRVCHITKKDLGLCKTNIWKSMLAGLLLSLFLAFLKGTSINEVPQSYMNSSVFHWFLWFHYCLISAAIFEEIIFRGVISTLLRSCTKHFSIITGILFSLSHIPFVLVSKQISFSAYFMSAFPGLVFFFIMHFLFQYLYIRYQNCSGPILLHFVIDYFQIFRIK